jgi:hypothetical protein
MMRRAAQLSVLSEVVLYLLGSCVKKHEAAKKGSASNLMIDFGQVRFFELHPVRRIICGVALCFLAALLATEAKAAWVASAGGSPNDITAVKLCSVAGKRLESAMDSPLARSHNPIDWIQVAAVCLNTTPFVQWRSFSTADPRGSGTPLELSYFSPPLFLRPPPAL